jgi:hypothetical protein
MSAAAAQNAGAGGEIYRTWKSFVCERARKNCENDFLACARGVHGSCGRVIKSLYSRARGGRMKVYRDLGLTAAEGNARHRSLRRLFA